MPEEIEPISFNDFCEVVENKVRDNDFEGAYAVYCMAYWIQQNPDKKGTREYMQMEARREDPIT